MKRVLVISDNPNLANILSNLIEQQSLERLANFEFRYSSVNQSPQSMIELSYSAINIKEANTVDWVIANFDLVLSIHCKQIFPSSLVNRVCCINVHPGLNPYNRGWYPQVFSIINHMPIGATIHVMNQDVDAGAIIAQQTVEMRSFDTSLTLYEKVQRAEISLLKQYLMPILQDDFHAVAPVSEGNYNSIEDFKKLCQLDLNNMGTLQSHLDLLRALSHGDFKNAYFVGESGQKVYVNINLTPVLPEKED